MKHTRKRRTLAQRLFPISLTSLRREVTNRLCMHSAPFARTNPVTPFGAACIIGSPARLVNSCLNPNRFFKIVHSSVLRKRNTISKKAVRPSLLHGLRYPFQRSRPPRRRPRYPSLDALTGRTGGTVPLSLWDSRNRPSVLSLLHGALLRGNIIFRCCYSIVGVDSPYQNGPSPRTVVVIGSPPTARMVVRAIRVSAENRRWKLWTDVR